MPGPADNQRNAASVDEETRSEALDEEKVEGTPQGATAEEPVAQAEQDEPGQDEPGQDEPGQNEPGQGESGHDEFEEAAGEPEAADEVRLPGQGEAGAPAEEGEPEDLAATLAEVTRERDEYLDALQRERAEFENFRRRANRERMEALDRGAENVIGNLLGVLDDFDRVLDAAEQSEDSQLAKGIEMVHNALRGVLAEAGLEEVPGAGAPFDPNWHEAMMQVEADEPTDQPVVFEVLRRGYRFKGRVLRPASVSVAQ